VKNIRVADPEPCRKSHRIAAAERDLHAAKMRQHELTPRQIEIVRAVLAENLLPAAAARRLGISRSAVVATVETAVNRMRVQHVTDLRPYVEAKRP